MKVTVLRVWSAAGSDRVYELLGHASDGSLDTEPISGFLKYEGEELIHDPLLDSHGAIKGTKGYIRTGLARQVRISPAACPGYEVTEIQAEEVKQ